MLSGCAVSTAAIAWRAASRSAGVGGRRTAEPAERPEEACEAASEARDVCVAAERVERVEPFEQTLSVAEARGVGDGRTSRCSDAPGDAAAAPVVVTRAAEVAVVAVVVVDADRADASESAGEVGRGCADGGCVFWCVCHAARTASAVAARSAASASCAFALACLAAFFAARLSCARVCCSVAFLSDVFVPLVVVVSESDALGVVVLALVVWLVATR